MENWKLSNTIRYWKLAATRTHKENWAALMAKAQRIRLGGGVNIEYNMPHYVAGQVQGDHGLYNTELSREDPETGSFTQWKCECEWFKYAWARTGKWKYLEGRFCSHALALSWESQVKAITPVEDVVPPSYRDDPEVLEQVEKLYAEEIQLQEPRIVEEVEAPPEPQPVEEEIPEEIPQFPVNWQIQPEPPIAIEEEPETPEEPPETFRNSKTANMQNMKSIRTVKDMLEFMKEE